eukprot:gene31983-39511_t
MLVSSDNLFTPYEFANEEVVGSLALQEQIIAMLTSREAPAGSYSAATNEYMVNNVIGGSPSPAPEAEQGNNGRNAVAAIGLNIQWLLASEWHVVA